MSQGCCFGFGDSTTGRSVGEEAVVVVDVVDIDIEAEEEEEEEEVVQFDKDKGVIRVLLQLRLKERNQR